jgi:mitotic spindle assembly checkpoint protein MAD2B
MAAPPNSTAISHLLSTHRSLVDTLTSFLTICTHHILYLRRVYPPVSFLSTRAYNYPIRQNRHPAVCKWINDAITAIRDQLTKNTVSNISLCIYETDSNSVLERWTFDLQSFPSVPKRDRDVPFSTATDTPDDLPTKINLVDLEATFRATLSRITTSANRLKPLPEPPHGPECSFTLTIELATNADRPVGRLEKEERKWIVAEPDPSSSATALQPSDSSPTASSPNANAGKIYPIRRLSTGPLHLELYVAESAAKFTYNTPNERTPSVRAAEMSYGAGTEKFDTVHGYDDLEGTDVNRKPGGGIGTDYQRM